ncbi:uncharacterized protein A1O9_02669 [Exophiala aquamarina CBS 119918]|uniref:Multiple myeloma tumor-associated protein 2-like N-terminal domain-containing protein n=1 Tax=Exophiala aquamarina CBS 119918 TaxID=1182545 RepID=A0A072PLX3_9EURO|nr:uncharacterized protein A1O9_02669 [Exophiala aquamarina CBS 119918]KEF61104.1 hypothetical protein A1O9_02669 [Exophiala aquamarina CBS 119918]
MDLLATVRKEGSRGGRADFKWSDVQGSSHRENYLGHSLMAPVGRWQKGRDLNWYAKADPGAHDNSAEDPATTAARERKEEIQRIKQAEEDALARALGLPVAPRNNPNMDELGGQREVSGMLKNAADGNDAAASRGIGYGRPAGLPNPEMVSPPRERIEGFTNPGDAELQYALKEYKRRHDEPKRDGRRRHRSRSKSRDRDRERKRRRDDGGRHRESHRGKYKDQRSRGHSSSLERPARRRSYSPSDTRNEAAHHRERGTHRSSDRKDRERRGHHDDRRRYDKP